MQPSKAKVRRWSFSQQTGSVSTPALAVVGAHDRLTPPWYHEALAEGLPDCGLVTLPDAAHLAMLETPAAFNEALTAFLGPRSSAATGTD